jgi:hypothetical protein
MARYYSQRTPLTLSKRNPSAAAGMGQVSGAAGNVDVGAIFRGIDSGNPFADTYNIALGAEYEKERARRLAGSNAFIAAMNAKTAEDGFELMEQAATPKTESFNPFKALTSVASIALPLITSDRRLKNTIEELEDSLALINQLRPVSFYYSKGAGEDPTRKHYGFIAQEYEEVMPDAVYRNDDSGYLCIDTVELIGLLVGSVQQLNKRVIDLELLMQYN